MNTRENSVFAKKKGPELSLRPTETKKGKPGVVEKTISTEEEPRDTYLRIESQVKILAEKAVADLLRSCAPEDKSTIKNHLGILSTESGNTRAAAQFFAANIHGEYMGEKHEPEMLIKLVEAHLEALTKTCKDLLIYPGEVTSEEVRKKRNEALQIISGSKAGPLSSLVRLVINQESRKLLGMNN